MSDEQLYEQIEDYLRGKLPEEEAKAFRARIESDPALKEEVDKHRAALLAVRLHSEAEMRKKVESWKRKRQDVDEPIYPKSSIALAWLKWAATLVLLVAAVWWITKPPEIQQEGDIINPTIPAVSVPYKPAAGDESDEKESPSRPRLATIEGIVKRANRPFGESPVLRKADETGESAAPKDTVSIAIDMLRTLQAAKALQILDACLTCDSIDVAQWRGYANFRLGRYAQSVQDYNTWFERGFSKKDAQWYLLLACLANGKQPAATYTDAIAAIRNNPKHPHHDDLLSLEKEMKKAGFSLK